MARIEITVDTAAAEQALGRAATALDGDQRTLLLKDIGEHLLRSTRERAKREMDPDGNKWRELSPGYARWKKRKRPGVPILKFDNHMLGDQLSWQVDGNDLLVGTAAKYGAIHQFGGTIPIAARSQKIYRGSVGPRFVEQRKATRTSWATIKEHAVTMPARPFLGVSKSDADQIVQLLEDHLLRALAASG